MSVTEEITDAPAGGAWGSLFAPSPVPANPPQELSLPDDVEYIKADPFDASDTASGVHSLGYSHRQIDYAIRQT